jgi:hypothetical protein
LLGVQILFGTSYLTSLSLKAFHVHLQVLSLDEVELVFVGLLNVLIYLVNGGHHFIVKIDPGHDKNY